MGDGYLASAEDHAEVVRRELLLLNPAVRSNPHRVRELLHPDFLEFGASGRRWDLEAVVEALAIDPSSHSQEPTELAPVHVADDVVLLTYRIDDQNGASLRSSLWIREGGSWRLRFHQGTPALPGRTTPAPYRVTKGWLRCQCVEGRAGHQAL